MFQMWPAGRWLGAVPYCHYVKLVTKRIHCKNLPVIVLVTSSRLLRLPIVACTLTAVTNKFHKVQH